MNSAGTKTIPTLDSIVHFSIHTFPKQEQETANSYLMGGAGTALSHNTNTVFEDPVTICKDNRLCFWTVGGGWCCFSFIDLFDLYVLII